MEKFKYKGITFAEGWSGTFEQFKEQFEETEAFKSLQQKERLSEMKRIFQELIAFNKEQEKEGSNKAESI